MEIRYIASLTEHASSWKHKMYTGIIVFENLCLCPSTRKRKAGVFKSLHSGERFEKMRFTGYVLTVGQTGEKISVFKQKRMDTCGRGGAGP